MPGLAHDPAHAVQGVASVLAAQAASRTGQRDHSPGENLASRKVITPAATSPIKDAPSEAPSVCLQM